MGVDYDKKDHIAYITINNPDRANTMDQDSGKELNEAYAQVWDDRDVRVAILTAVGDRFFSAGHVLGASKDQGKPDEKPPHRADGMFWPGSGTTETFGNDARMGPGYPQIWKPVIAAVNGWAAGWGFFHLLSTTDIRIACEEHGRFKYGLLSLGGVGGGPGATLLPRQIAYADAMRILLTDEPFDAKEALRINLINEVVPCENLMSRAEEIATHIATKVPPLAVRMMKELVVRYRETPAAETWRVQGLMGALVNSWSTDTEEGRAAFREKRDPDYTGGFRDMA